MAFYVICLSFPLLLILIVKPLKLTLSFPQLISSLMFAFETRLSFLVINSNLSPSISKQTYFDFTDFQTAELRFKSTSRLAPQMLNSYDFCLRKQCGKVSPNRRVTIIKPFVNITSSWSWKQAISHYMQGIEFLGT